MRRMLVLVALAACSRSAPEEKQAVVEPVVAPAKPAEPTLPPVLAWPRMKSTQFGCLLEKAGHKDAGFHCGTAQVTPGDPCKDTTAYYAGPAFPAPLAARVHQKLASATLEWEHADLRTVTLTFAAGQMPLAEARAALALPAEGAPLPDNVMSIQVDESDGQTTVRLEGFEHMGAGDVECP